MTVEPPENLRTLFYYSSKDKKVFGHFTNILPWVIRLSRGGVVISKLLS